jgi:glycerophosphoryl diester phosphodiesterase
LATQIVAQLVPAKGLDSVPENSLAALERCIELGVDMMETDIHRTRDGALVIMHDDTVDRTTDGTGAVADLTLLHFVDQPDAPRKLER